MPQRYRYVIVGSQLSGASAADGVREMDQEGAILLIGREQHLPYDRPPLSKSLWLGKKTVEEITLHDAEHYEDHSIELLAGREVVGIDPDAKTIADTRGTSYEYEKLLLATGGQPRRLDAPGANLPLLSYYRSLDDYQHIRGRATEGASAAVVGGGFIGSEMAAALHSNGVEVTMVFDGPYLCDRVFPEGLGRAVQADYERRGVAIHCGDRPASFDQQGDRVRVRTQRGAEVLADFVIVGIGIIPETRLAEAAGLTVERGIVVDEQLRTSRPDIYSAGDVAAFPYSALDRRMRIEHWDHAVNQGKHVGRNMAGAGEPYDYMPYFFSDLFDFGYEAVGEVSAELSVVADWQEENATGVLYYLADDRVRGVMMCNVWDKVEDARALIREQRQVSAEELRGRIG
jgi:NAD(P)H-nitrite reductase large subunit